MRINDLLNNSIQNGTGTGINNDLSLVDGADSLKNKTTALLDGNKGAVGFFKQNESKLSGVSGNMTYSLNEAKGINDKKDSFGEKLLNSIESGQNNDKELVKNLTGDDYEALSDEGMSIEKFSRERLERAIERIKENREIREVRLEEGIEKKQEFRESVERMAIYSSLDSGTDKMIAKMLYEADIPVTKENIENVKQAADRAGTAVKLSDSSESYLIKNSLSPTIDNLYKASYAGEMRLVSLPDESWESLKDKAAEIVKEAGVDEEAGLRNARWLIEHDLPVTEENIAYKAELDALRAEKPGAERLYGAAVEALGRGEKALDGLLIVTGEDDGALVEGIRETVNKLGLIDDTAIKTACEKNVNADDISLTDLISAGGSADGLNGSSSISGSAGSVSSNAVAGDSASQGVSVVSVTAGVSVSQAGSAASGTAGVSAGQAGSVSSGKSGSTSDGSAVGSESLTDRVVTTKIRLEEIRYSLTIEAGRRLMGNGIDIMSDGLKTVLESIRELEREVFKEIYKEIEADYGKAGEIDGANADSAARLAADTEDSLRMISSAPLTLYKAAYNIRHSVTLAELSEDGELAIRETVETSSGSVSSGPASGNGGFSSEASYSSRTISINPASMKSALAYYEESSTEVRRDLGDSIKKAFSGSVDSLLESCGLEVNEGNRRAVRILGYNSMEINAESIENIKYFDAKVTGLIDRMTPPVVMTMIRNGINPLESTIDELDAAVSSIIKEQGGSQEQKYSEFLVRMEETDSITRNERNAYIGIYRLLYNVEKNDGAAIGSLLNSGRELSFRNLMTEARSMNSGIELTADDTSKIRSSHYTNSVTAQIDEAFIYQRSLAQDSLSVTDPLRWDSALSGKDYGSVTIEELHNGLFADNSIREAEYQEVKASEIVQTMASSSAASDFLNSFGIRDSFENRKATEDILANPEKENSAIELSSDELESALDSYSRFDELLGIKTRMANSLAGEAFRTAITAQSAAELNSRVERIDMLSRLAGKGHYRMNVTDGEDAKKVNLTLIQNSGNAGTVSVQISKPDYNIQADLNMIIMESDYSGSSGLGNGRADTVSAANMNARAFARAAGQEMPASVDLMTGEGALRVSGAKVYVDGNAPLNSSDLQAQIKSSLKDNGINADNINIVTGTRSEEAYLSYLARQARESGEMSPAAAGLNMSGRAGENRGNATESRKSREGLLRVAKSLLSAFI